MSNFTLSFYLNGLFQMHQQGEITENQMNDYANIIVRMVEEDGFTEEYAEAIFAEIRKNIEDNHGLSVLN